MIADVIEPFIPPVTPQASPFSTGEWMLYLLILGTLVAANVAQVMVVRRRRGRDED